MVAVRWADRKRGDKRTIDVDRVINYCIRYFLALISLVSDSVSRPLASGEYRFCHWEPRGKHVVNVCPATTT